MKKENDVVTIDAVLEDAETVVKKQGRPRDNAEKADKRVVIYLTASQLEDLEEYCFKTKRKVGTYIKETFLDQFYRTAEKDKDAIKTFVDKIDAEELGKVVKEFLRGKKKKDTK